MKNISYPRVCDNCDHVSNNAAMWHYHKRIHFIPTEICYHGCGRAATRYTTAMNPVCQKDHTACPGYLASLSIRTQKSWKQDNSSDRRDHVSKIMRNMTTEQKENHKQKSLLTRYKKQLASPDSEDKKKYVRKVRSLTAWNMKNHSMQVNPESLKIGKNLHHIDHLVSIHVGWILGIPPATIAHPANLCVLNHFDNVKKGFRCSIHPIDLLRITKMGLDEIHLFQKKVSQLEDSVLQLLIPHTR